MEIKTEDITGHEHTKNFFREKSFTHEFAEVSKKMKKHELSKITVKYAGYCFTLTSEDGTITLDGTIPRDLIPLQGHGSISLTESGMMAVDFSIPEEQIFGEDKQPISYGEST